MFFLLLNTNDNEEKEVFKPLIPKAFAEKVSIEKTLS